MHYIEQVIAFSALKNGVRGELFAGGGVSLAVEGGARLSHFGIRCPIVGAIDTTLKKHVLPNLGLAETSTSPRIIVKTATDWLSKMLTARGTVVIQDIPDPTYEVDLLSYAKRLDIPWFRGLEGVAVTPIDLLLGAIGIKPRQRRDFEDHVLGAKPHSCNPVELAEGLAQLALAALLISTRLD
jgi:hypothetical protein